MYCEEYLIRKKLVLAKHSENRCISLWMFKVNSNKYIKHYSYLYSHSSYCVVYRTVLKSRAYTITHSVRFDTQITSASKRVRAIATSQLFRRIIMCLCRCAEVVVLCVFCG